MKILVAPNAFKGCLTARAAAAAIARGVRRAAPEAELVELAVADGGDGTLEVIVDALAGETREAAVHDALGRPIRAQLGLVHGGRTAVVDVASASGLARLAPSELDPLRASSFGTGELIAAGLAAGAERVLLGVGGSATVDGGLGLLAALGVRWLDARGAALSPSGGALAELASVDVSQLSPLLANREIVVLSDVDNPLTGEHGAAAVFAAQKGANASQQAELGRGLERLARLLEHAAGRDIAALRGSGAAGGIPASASALLGARIVPGADYVLDLLDFEERLRGAALVITGEGRLDAQSQFNKAPLAVARRAAGRGVPTLALAGSIADDLELASSPFSAALAISRAALPLEAALAHATDWLTATSEHAMRVYLLGRRAGGY